MTSANAPQSMFWKKKTFERLATECDSIIEMSMLNAKFKSQELEPVSSDSDKAKKRKLSHEICPKCVTCFFLPQHTVLNFNIQQTT